MFKKIWQKLFAVRRALYSTSDHDMNGMYIRVYAPEMPAFVISLQKQNSFKGVSIAWAMLSGDVSEVLLWMIYVRPKYRKKGYAKQLIEILQSKHDKIVTHYTDEIINEPGTRLCLSMGFKPFRATRKKDAHQLIWRK